MRLRIEQFDFRGAGNDAWIVVQPGKKTALARIVRDRKYSTMWRVVRPDDSLSDMLNLTRAKDLAFGVAETALYLRLSPKSQPAKTGHFFNDTRPPLRPIPSPLSSVAQSSI